MSKKTKAPRRSSGEWAALIEACSRSGLSYAAFAQREGIHPGTFTWWASKLGAGGRRRSLERGATAAANTATFVPVRVRSSAPTRARVASELARPSARLTASSSTVEVVLGNGRRVCCDLEQVDDPRLAALLRIAEGGGVC
jgi:transposase-like protein